MNEKTTFTSFLPLLLIVLGLIGWVGGEDYQIGTERAKIAKQVSDQAPALADVDTAKARYVNFLKDLLVTGKTDAGAKTVVLEAMRSGIIQARQRPPEGATNAAPVTPAQ